MTTSNNITISDMLYYKKEFLLEKESTPYFESSFKSIGPSDREVIEVSIKHFEENLRDYVFGKTNSIEFTVTSIQGKRMFGN